MDVFPIATDKQATEPPKNITKIDTKAVPITVTLNQSSTPESPSTPTQVTLAKAPTPWLQNKNKPQEELPEWATKRACINKAVSSDPSESAPSPTVYVQVQETKQKQEQEQHPTPQLCQPKSQQQPSQQQSQRQKQIAVSATSQQINPQSHQQERVIPIRVS